MDRNEKSPRRPQGAAKPLSDRHYAALAEFRHELRRFLHFSETAAVQSGITPQQHQALLAVRGAKDGVQTVGELAERLLIRPHSATGLAGRLVKLGLLERIRASDRRIVRLRLTDRAETLLTALSHAHQDELRRVKPLLMKLIDGIA